MSVGALAVGIVYHVIARLSLDLASVHPSATAISAPAGFAFAAVLVGGYRVVPAIFAAAFFVHALSSGPSYVAAATAAGNALEAFAGCLMVNRLAAGRNAFADPTSVAKFAGIAMFGAAIGATVGCCRRRASSVWVSKSRAWSTTSIGGNLRPYGSRGGSAISPRYS